MLKVCYLLEFFGHCDAAAKSSGIRLVVAEFVYWYGCARKPSPLEPREKTAGSALNLPTVPLNCSMSRFKTSTFSFLSLATKRLLTRCLRQTFQTDEVRGQDSVPNYSLGILCQTSLNKAMHVLFFFSIFIIIVVVVVDVVVATATVQ